MNDWKALGLDFVTLRVFKASVEEGSFVGAAEREHLVPSAISRRIANFENRLGLSLLHRHDRGVIPTSAGKLLLKYVDTIFSMVDQTIIDLDAFVEGRHGHVKLMANLSCLSAFFPRLISDFKEKNQNVDIILEQGKSGDIIRGIENNIVDIGVISGAQKIDNITSFEIGTEQLVVIYPSQHKLSESTEPLKFLHITNEQFISLSKEINIHSIIRNRALSLGVNIYELVNVGSYDVIKQCVIQGLGIAVVPFEVAITGYDLLPYGVRLLDEKWAKYPIKLCVKRMELLNPSAKLVVKFILHEFDFGLVKSRVN